jgi:hypothetical protein
MEMTPTDSYTASGALLVLPPYRYHIAAILDITDLLSDKNTIVQMKNSSAMKLCRTTNSVRLLMSRIPLAAFYLFLFILGLSYMCSRYQALDQHSGFTPLAFLSFYDAFTLMYLPNALGMDRRWMKQFRATRVAADVKLLLRCQVHLSSERFSTPFIFRCGYKLFKKPHNEDAGLKLASMSQDVLDNWIAFLPPTHSNREIAGVVHVG